MSHNGQTAPSATRSNWVAAALFASTVVLLFTPFPFRSPVPASPHAPSWATDPTPVRRPKLRPEYVVGVYTYRCSDCHDIIPLASVGETRGVMIQHREIVLQHGINARCLNCHHPKDRDGFVDDFGNTISWNQPQLVCAKCHGPVYRDWQRGSHGRTNGFWDTSKGAQTLRKCTECHDPHRPPFPSMQPAPGPNTPRMGPQDHRTHAREPDPLRLGHRAKPPSAVDAPDEEP